MKLFYRYLRQKRRSLLAVCGAFLIFFVTFLLYRLPLGAVAYPILLCALLGAVLMARDFCRVRMRHETLQNIRNLSDLTDDIFLRTDGIEEEDYQTILRLLREEQIEFQNMLNRKYSDMVDYYTVWAHQIKTPIASMRLNLQNEDSALARTLFADLFRIEQYVEMVLMFLRLDSESTDYVFREHDLDGIVRQAVKKYADEFIVRRLKLNYEPCEAVVVTDDKWLSFVIGQVLSNALKYTPRQKEGSPAEGCISIYMEPGKKLCIRDTGIGIAPEDLPRIFEKGFTGYNGHTDKSASGIGLYLCRRVCENLGHGIFASSAVDEGTTITIDLGQVKRRVE